MKKVSLKKISVQNFRSKSFEFSFGEKNVLSGRNRCGKSTVKNAFLWLLTGYDDEDRANFNLFDTTVEYTHETAVPAEVSAILAIDGLEYELKRSARMGWTRPRGKEEFERKNSDDYSFSIDGIGRTATEFKKWVEENLAPIDMVKCMLNTQHFLYLIEDWKVQRKYLANIAGEISDSDYTGDYTELFDQFKKYTAEELRERLKTLLLPLKKALGTENTKGEKTVELEVLQKNLVDLKSITDAEIALQTLKEERDKEQSEIRDMQAPVTDIAKKREEVYKAMETLERSMREAKAVYNKEQAEKRSGMEMEIVNADTKNAAIARENAMLKRLYEQKQQSIISNKSRLEQMEARLQELRIENIAIKSREFSDNTCAYCGAPLSEEKIAENKAKFEAQKERDRENNKNEGLQLKQSIETLKADIDLAQKDLDAGLQQHTYVNVDDVREKLQKAIMATVPFEDTEECHNLQKAIEDTRKTMPELPTIDTTAQDARIKELNNTIDEVNRIVGQRNLYAKQVQQIDAVKAEMKAMAQERASLEKIEQQLVAYEQEKADIVGRRVNNFFDKCRVSMFSVKKDGSLAPNCVITMDGRRAATLNKEGTITAGVDVSNAFCKFYGLNLPLFVDDYESVSADRDIVSDRQIIALKVDNSDLTLTKL